MNPLCDQLLAGARLTLNQNRCCLTPGNLLHHGKDILHGDARTDDIGKADFLMLDPEACYLPPKIRSLKSLSDDDGHLIQIERFVEIVVGAHSHCGNGSFKPSVSCHHDHDDIFIELLELLQNLDSAYSRKLDIKKDQIRLVFPDNPQGIFATPGGKHLIPLLLKVLLKRPADQVLVIDNQN